MSYYIIQNDETKGPYTIGQLRSMWNAGAITGKVVFCKEGDAEWRPLSTILGELEPLPAAAATPSPAVILTRQSKSRGIYIILGILLGLFGIHNFYAGYYGRGAAQLIITILFGFSAMSMSSQDADAGAGMMVMVFLIVGIWVLIELVSVTKDAEGQKMT